MKKIDLGQSLTILANLGVVVGILLLVYELNQTRQFAKMEYSARNRHVFQEIEREFMNPEVAVIWAKTATDPASLTGAEIRVMDAYLLNLYNYFRQQWIYELSGFLEPGTTESKIMIDIPFYFGNGFAQVWWKELKSAHVTEEVLELDALIDKALADTDPSANLRYIERIQQRVREQAAER